MEETTSTATESTATESTATESTAQESDTPSERAVITEGSALMAAIREVYSRLGERERERVRKSVVLTMALAVKHYPETADILAKMEHDGAGNGIIDVRDFLVDAVNVRTRLWSKDDTRFATARSRSRF